MNRFLIAALCISFTALTANAGVKPKADKGKKAAPAGDLTKAFTTLDSNSDGRVSLDEFKKITTVLPLPKAKKNAGTVVETMFNKLDTNKDGYLSLEEFKSINAAKAKKEKKSK